MKVIRRISTCRDIGLVCLVVLVLCALPRPLRADDLALASVSALAMDMQSGAILLAENEAIVLPIASLTKLMTALVVVESGEDLDAWLTSEDWQTKTEKNAFSRIRLASAARRQDLLRIALMSSENRAAYNLAVHHPGGVEAFVSAMNDRARLLAMNDTRFSDPTGLDVGNRSSAADLARLLRAAYQRPLLREYSTTRQYQVNFRNPAYSLGYGNTHRLTASKRWDVTLSKTGYLTEAGRCLMMVSQMDGRQVGVVLLNSFGTRSPLGDAGRIRRYLETGTRSLVAPAALEYRNRVLARFRVSPN